MYFRQQYCVMFELKILYDYFLYNSRNAVMTTIIRIRKLSETNCDRGLLYCRKLEQFIISQPNNFIKYCVMCVDAACVRDVLKTIY